MNRRGAAFFVDSLIAIIVATICEVFFRWEHKGLGGDAIYCALIAIKDSIGGCSPGKLIFGIRAVSARTGQPIGIVQSIARNWIFVVPFMPFIVGLMLKRGRRWGDGLAETKICLASEVMPRDEMQSGREQSGRAAKAIAAVAALVVICGAGWFGYTKIASRFDDLAKDNRRLRGEISDLTKSVEEGAQDAAPTDMPSPDDIRLAAFGAAMDRACPGWGKVVQSPAFNYWLDERRIILGTATDNYDVQGVVSVISAFQTCVAQASNTMTDDDRRQAILAENHRRLAEQRSNNKAAGKIAIGGMPQDRTTTVPPLFAGQYGKYGR